MVKRNLLFAVRAKRTARLVDAQVQREAVNDDVQEGADDGAQDECEDFEKGEGEQGSHAGDKRPRSGSSQPAR